MKIQIDRLKYFHEIGGLKAGSFGNAKETACLMSALTGATDFEGCEAEGWPKWLAELAALREQYRWVPVSERLPDKGVNVLVFDTSYIETERQFVAYYDDDGWVGYEGDTPSAWMPLPPAPDAEENKS